MSNDDLTNRISFSRPKRALGVASLVLLSFAGAAWWAYARRGPIQNWFRSRAVAVFLENVQPKLPFQVEQFEIRQGSWADFLKWRIPDLLVAIRWQVWRFHLEGPIEVECPDPGEKSGCHETSIHYRPVLTFAPVEPVPQSLRGIHPEPFAADLSLRFKHLDEITRIDFKAEAATFAWPPLGLKAEGPDLSFSWQDRQARLLWHARQISWAQKADRAAQLGVTEGSAQFPLELKPFRLGPEVTVTGSTQAAEILWGDLDLSPPPALLSLRLNTTLGSDFKPQRAELALGPPSRPIKITGSTPGSYQVTLTTPEFPIGEVVSGALKAISGSGGPWAALSTLKGIEFRSGKGRIRARAEIDSAKLEPRQLDGQLTIRDLGFRWPKKALEIQKLSLDLPISSNHEIQGQIEIPSVLFKHAHLHLRPTRITASYLGPEGGTRARIPFRIADRDHPLADALPLTIDELKLHLGALVGTYHLGEPASPAEGDDSPLELTTSLVLDPTPVSNIIAPLCITPKNLPPAQASVNFPRIDLSTQDIDPTGEVRVNLFGGTITANEIGFFDLFTPVPETDFTADIHGVQLDQFGDWAGFGEMDGLLQGYAHDVTIQGWLPTHFDFRMEVKPQHKSKVVFSPDAMKNFVRLVAGENLDRLPGIAEWLAFGWPSRLFGGYDISYAGVSIFSDQGHIVLKTLDPPDEGRPNGKHFILYGPRFKMPLQSSSYPLVVDNTAMGNFARRFALQLIEMARRKRAEKQAAATANQEVPLVETDDDSSHQCLPAEWGK